MTDEPKTDAIAQRVEETQSAIATQVVAEQAAASVEKLVTESVPVQKAIAANSTHHWEPDDGQPIIGFNPTAKGEKFVVLRDVTYVNPLVIVPIPAGFVTDLASIPRFAWWLPGLSPLDANARGCLVHDAIYRHQQVDRVIADALLLSIMREDGVGWLTRYAIYSVVRICGTVAWANNARKLRNL